MQWKEELDQAGDERSTEDGESSHSTNDNLKGKTRKESIDEPMQSSGKQKEKYGNSPHSILNSLILMSGQLKTGQESGTITGRASACFDIFSHSHLPYHITTSSVTIVYMTLSKLPTCD